MRTSEGTRPHDLLPAQNRIAVPARNCPRLLESYPSPRVRSTNQVARGPLRMRVYHMRSCPSQDSAVVAQVEETRLEPLCQVPRNPQHSRLQQILQSVRGNGLAKAWRRFSVPVRRAIRNRRYSYPVAAAIQCVHLCRQLRGQLSESD